MKKEKKNEILENYYNSLCKSWTYERMSEQEKAAFKNIKEWIKNSGPLENMNTEKNITYCLLVSYHSFLIGIGYNGKQWRE